MPIEINLLPPGYRPRRSKKPFVVAAALAAALAGGLFGLIKLNKQDRSAAADSAATVSTVTTLAVEAPDDPRLQSMGLAMQAQLRELSAKLELLQSAFNAAKEDPDKFERFLEVDVDQVAQQLGPLEAEAQVVLSRFTESEQKELRGSLTQARQLVRELQQLHADAELFKSYLITWRSRVNNLDRMYRANPNPLSFAVAMSGLLRNTPGSVVISRPEHADLMLSIFRQKLSSLTFYVLEHRTHDPNPSEVEVLRGILRDHRREIEILPAFKNFIAVLTSR